MTYVAFDGRGASHHSSSNLSSTQQRAWLFYNLALTTGRWSTHHGAKISEKKYMNLQKGDCQISKKQARANLCWKEKQVLKVCTPLAMTGDDNRPQQPRKKIAQVFVRLSTYTKYK